MIISQRNVRSSVLIDSLTGGKVKGKTRKDKIRSDIRMACDGSEVVIVSNCMMGRVGT